MPARAPSCALSVAVMAKNLTPQQALEAARRANDARLQAVRILAEARQNVMDVRESSARDVEAAKAKAATEIRAAELADVKAWDAALRAGWQMPELRRIGFTEAEKRARVRRRRDDAVAPSPGRTGAGKHPDDPTANASHDTRREAAREKAAQAAPDLTGANHD